jgi:ferritin
MLSPAMQDALNDQIRNEFFSSYVYLSMAAWFDDRNLPG